MSRPFSSARGRITAGFGFLVLMLVAVAAGSAWQVHKHRSDTAAMEDHADTLFLIQNGLVNAEAAASGVQRYVMIGGETPIAGDEELLPRIRSDMTEAEESLAQALADTERRGDTEQAARLYRVSAAADSLIAGVEMIIALQQSGDAQAAAAGLEVAVAPFREFENTLEAAAESELADVSRLRSDADRAGDLALWLLIISGATGAVLGVATSVIIARSIIRPLSSLEEAAIAVSQGDFEARAQAAGPRELANLGSALNQMTESLLDASKRRELEEALKFRQFSLDHTSDAVFWISADAGFVDVNEAACRSLGYSREELLSMTVDDIDPDFASDLRPEKWGELKQRGSVTFESRHRTKDGRTFPVEVSSNYLEFNGKEYDCAFARDITERKRVEEMIRHLAYHDALTDLPNRALFEDRLTVALAQARRKGQMAAVMFLDLDRFKVVNDTVGHALGDQLLQTVAERLTGLVREGDTVARVGGDEFTLLLPEVGEASDAVEVAERVLETLRQPWGVGNHEFHVTTSIGIALYPSDGEDAQSLLRNADTAMYRAKDRGKDNYKLFTAAMNTRIKERVALESSLRRGLEREEFVVHYQPQVSISSGRVVGAEALVRWLHPKRGLVLPGDFIPAAEDTGLIVPLGEWVLRTACAQNRAWQDAGIPPVRVAVNLSARQFQSRDLPGTIAQALEETGLDPQYLELEITEGVAMQDTKLTVDMLRELREMGVGIAIDDFGTGYSSLSYLKLLPVNAVKIDRSFVRDLTVDPNDAAIASSIISMAHNLKLEVIAEGVETKEQLAFLKERHCDKMQGFLLSRAAPAEAVEKMLSQAKRGERQLRRKAVAQP